ncbi:MAG TPA: metallophosphoesterase family protein [Candidatus Hydrogenedentes bacterium]|mgnify:FL=1|nr:metallophosphoesterase family protein [Candidatus Hydrogenedentota bacterium]HQE83182.1 metallophosphoesterase family protein [Candidatus Hydrogenedentota bacterium]HQH50797.1 metallophosphoesterase family protein [Candidatus Hydrogenedentota bacterium]HQM47735.1 metallophosphoesterase family protein [Candidatus Hydrogenedentota bacterium]
MRYAILSDIHANIEAMEAVLGKIDALDIDQVLCLGDIVGYNANPNECTALIRERGIPTVCGNHDAVACGREEPWGFNRIALEAAIWTREALTQENIEWLNALPDAVQPNGVIGVHGAPGDRDSYMFTWEDVSPHFGDVSVKGRNACFFGHTHVPGIFESDGGWTPVNGTKFILKDGPVTFINPGSVGQPRDGDPRASFGVYDTIGREFSLVRVKYNVKAAMTHIRNSGLPDYLADRLEVGR